MPEHIKRGPLTEEDYMTYGPNIAGFAWAILEAREELEQEGYTTKMEGSKRDIKMRLRKEASKRGIKKRLQIEALNRGIE
jgi:hypothetical protein